MDVLVEDQVAETGAALAGRAEGGPVSAGNRIVEVGAGHHYEGVLAAQFETA